MIAALELMVTTFGNDRKAIATWVGAGAVGAAVGPGLGGLLTELVSWQSIFLIQVPIAIIAGVPLREIIVEETREWKIPEPVQAVEGSRPHLPANIALALVSAAIAATLFLIVLLLIEGWLLTPIEAAAVVTVLPVAALVGSRLGNNRSNRSGSGPLRARSCSPAAWPRSACSRRPRSSGDPAADPRRHRSFAGPVGTDRGRAARPLGRCGPRRLDDRRPPRRCGDRPADPHPDLHHSARTSSGMRPSMPAPRSFSTLRSTRPTSSNWARSWLREVESQGERVPDLSPAFEPLPTDPEQRDQYEQILSGIEDQLEEAATNAFSLSFLLSALFGLLALIPIGMTRRLDL